MNNDTVSVYEACSTAVYQHGRTETIRPATVESNDLVETYLANLANLDDPIKRAEIKDKLLIAIKKHNSITKKAIAGQGFDRHLFALKYYAQKNGIELVRLFSIFNKWLKTRRVDKILLNILSQVSLRIRPTKF